MGDDATALLFPFSSGTRLGTSVTSGEYSAEDKRDDGF